MKKHKLFAFLTSFFGVLAFCACLIISYVYFPINSPNISGYLELSKNGKTEDGYKTMAEEFAQILGYESFDTLINRTNAIVDKSIAYKPYSEKVQEVAVLLKYPSFEKMYFETVRVFNTHNPIDRLSEIENVFYLLGEQVFHSEHCVVLENKNGEIGKMPNRDAALDFGFSSCTECTP